MSNMSKKIPRSTLSGFALRSMKAPSAVVLMALAALPSEAHYLWIESEGNSARVYFGEYQGKPYEAVRHRASLSFMGR